MGADIRMLGRITALGLALSALAWPGQAQIISSKHNLSVSAGSGARTASGDDEVCYFCHAPHTESSATARWSRSAAPAVYSLYSSTMLDASPMQPTNDSKLCLSCHDGTIALGSDSGRPVPFTMTSALPERSDLTTDLSDDHPISFVYSSGVASDDGQLVDPSLLTGDVKLDADDQMQCTSCHDSHSSPFPKMLVEDPAYSALCLTCHDRTGWPGSIHELSTATWDGSGVDPWPHTPETTVGANACESCHAPHAAGSYDLLLNFLVEEDNCLSCHTGNVADLDIGAQIRKRYSHGVDLYLGIHDPSEDFDSMPRHVECEDCHNPHSTTTAGATAPNASGALNGAAGVTASGAYIQRVDYEYEVCFRCHADSSNAPAPRVSRQIFEPNLRTRFDTSNPSYHPVEAVGKNADVPSLLTGWSESSIIYCTDCHNNDNGPGAGGSGPNGPHGSRWEFLLEREYRTEDGTFEDGQTYSMCYKCHSRSSILNDESFKEHDKHIRDERSPCSACHDPHGAPSGSAADGDHTHLINFDLSIVSPNSKGELYFQDRGSETGACYLSCHGEDHDGEDY